MKETHLDECIGLKTFGVLHGDLQAVGRGGEDGVVFESDCFQDVGQIASIIQTGNQSILLIISLRLSWQRHSGAEKHMSEICVNKIGFPQDFFYMNGGKYLLVLWHISICSKQQTFWKLKYKNESVQ